MGLRYIPTTEADRWQIASWIIRFPGGVETEPDDWIVKCAYRVDDEQGPLMYVRNDTVGKKVWFHVQLGDASKKRVARGMKEGFAHVARLLKQNGFVEAAMRSIIPSVVRISRRMGFEPVGNDEYVFQL